MEACYEQKYKPFQPTPESYVDNHRGQTLARILGAFNDVLGIPPAIIKKDFRALLEKTVANTHPKYRCSSARAVVEGRIPGVAKIIDGLPVSMKGQLNRALALLDILETIVNNALESEAKTFAGESLKEAKRLKEVFGTVKVPQIDSELIVEPPAPPVVVKQKTKGKK